MSELKIQTDEQVRLSEQTRMDRLLQFLHDNQVKPDRVAYNWLCCSDFFRAPASTRWHSAYPGGLFDHSLKVAQYLMELTQHNNLVWEQPDSPIVIGILHDATKIGLYEWRSWENKYKTNPFYKAEGVHGHDSIHKISLLHDRGLCSPLTQEEILCIRYHMGAYETTDWEGFDKAIKRCPNVLWTHMADMLASKLGEEWKNDS